MPPPLPTSRKGRFFALVLIAWGCLSFVTLVILLVGYLDREGILDFRTSGSTDYYYTADLEALHLPQWYGTNTIPLTPDHAVLAATRHLRTNYPSLSHWDVDRIELRKQFDTTWTCEVALKDRRPGRHAFEIVRVLMDGSIWKPSSKRNEP